MTDLKPPELLSFAPPASWPTVPTDDAVDLVELVRLLGREWRWIVGIAGAFLLGALILAYTLPPTYRADVLLAPVAPPKSEVISSMGALGDIASLVESYVGGGKDRTSESIATLRSRALGLEFIREENLKPLLFPDEWDGAHRRWRDPSRAPSDLKAYERFDKSVRDVRYDRRTGLVTLSIEWRDPGLAAGWANRLVARLNAHRRAEAIEEAQKSIDYMQRQLLETPSLDVRQALFRLIEAQMKTIAIARARAEYAFRVVDPALAPERRARPQRLLLVLGGLIAGLLVAVLTVLARRAFRRVAVPLG